MREFLLYTTPRWVKLVLPNGNTRGARAKHSKTKVYNGKLSKSRKFNDMAHVKAETNMKCVNVL